MSLVKLDEKGKIKADWLVKKSTKRLRVILFKLRFNYNKLQQVSEILQNHGLDTNEVCGLIGKYTYSAAQLDNIIFRRTENLEITKGENWRESKYQSE